MIYAEVVVNVPIRRSFGARAAPPQDELADGPGRAGMLAEADDQAARADYRLFHYHIPVELETRLRPGHLVWAPFGARNVQGFVVRLADSSPVPTKPISRLARPEPVLTPTQIELAFWITDYYLAPLSETIKLFMPPGLLAKEEGGATVRAKRELLIEPRIKPEQIDDALLRLGRETQQTRILSHLIANPDVSFATADLLAACGPAKPSAIRALAAKGLVNVNDGRVRLLLTASQTREQLVQMRGVGKFLPVLYALAKTDGAIWKSDLYAQVSADMNLLRQLEAAGLIEMTEQLRLRDPLVGRHYPKSFPPPLTDQQQAVWHTIEATAFAGLAQGNAQQPDATSNGATAFLLHGVTGSGKTEIYLRAIARVLEAGRQAIVLVPEIALTPQTVARFAGRFPGRVTVVHSELSQGERYDVWRSIRDGEFDVVVGPRSALFAPMARVGLIVIDEEHEATYKQDAEEWGSFTVFYDARTVAHQLAELTGSLLLMGSATPSLERYAAAKKGEITLLELPRRVLGHQTSLQVEPSGDKGAAAVPTLYAEMPPVEVVDMRQELRAGNRSMFSRSLQAELHATLDAGEQAILFLNRRGTSTFVMCRDCGDVQECSRCEVPLTYHERADVLICHHCNRRYPIPLRCPECDSKRIKYFGSGTQRVEEFVQQISPRARLLRWDADTTGRKGRHEEILQRFANHDADILIGTQMIAKGLDLPLVTLVGVVAADVGLYLPDFRSGERTFQLLTQVAGRAGRSERGGRVVLQSYKPEHYAIQAAAQHDYDAFFLREISFRQEHYYPPIRRMVRLVYWDKKLDKAKLATALMAEQLEGRIVRLGLEGRVSLFGPAPAFFARYRGNYRWQIMLGADNPAQVLQGLDIPFGWRVDIDPMSIL